MFQAIQRADHATLCTLAKTFIGTRNDIAAVLCLDHVFSSPLELRNIPISGVQELLSLYLNYLHLLIKLQGDESLSNTSNKQRLFGFQAQGEGRLLVPKRTLLYGKLANKSGSGGRGDDGHVCGYEELRRSINGIIGSRIIDHTKLLDDTCRGVHGLSPCLQLLVQGECNPLEDQEPCTFQHVQTEELTVDWYHARLRLILLQFEILDTARRVYFDFDVIK